MLTVDFDRLGLLPGDRVLDMGAGAGRHSFEMYRRGADVIAFDMDAEELENVRNLFVAMKEAGEVPDGAEADVKQGDALALPFADGEFDRIVAAEVLEHIWEDVAAIRELVRVLRPGGTLAISVPRWLPEVVNWKLSEDYHNTTGGHIRIYTDHELIDKVTKAGRPNDGTPGEAMIFEGKSYAHGLHAPYWWLKSAVGVDNDKHVLVKAYHQILVWEIMKNPLPLRLAGKVLDPMIGKSMVLYFRKPGPIATDPTSAA
jgi:SAM-dependent methyltransferase